MKNINDMNIINKKLFIYIGGSMVFKTIGAKDFVYDNENDYIQFHFPNCKKANILKIQYDYGQDLISMFFYKYNRKTLECPLIKEYKNLFFDQVIKIFETFTGLKIFIF